MTRTYDARRATRAEQYIFKQVKLAEIEYSRKLRQLAKQVQQLATEMLKDAPDDAIGVHISAAHVIRQYGDAITPWARIVAEKMVRDVALRDSRAWRERAKHISWGLEDLVKNTPIGHIMQERIDAQVGLITSIPRDVALRVQEMAIQSTWTGERYGSIAAEIMKTTDASLARANLIARTEVARTTTEITRARAEFVGATQYVWRTAGDEDVRPALHLPAKTRRNMIGSHRALEGKVISWDDPPVSGQRGERAHAGQIYNCFVGDTLINMDVGCKRVWRMSYNGPIVHLRFNDELLRVTPNHPILTERGLIPVGEVECGDKVISVVQHVREFSEAKQDKLFTRFDDLFLAGSQVHVTPRLANLFDFHGHFPQSDVDEVTFADLLPCNREPLFFQEVCEFVFANTDVIVGKTLVSRFLRILEHACTSTDHVSFALFHIAQRCRELIGLGKGSGFDTGRFEATLNGIIRNVVTLGELVSGAGSLVGFDDVFYRQVYERAGASAVINGNAAYSQPFTQSVSPASNGGGGLLQKPAIGYKTFSVIDKSIGDFSGHVYTLESYTGYYGVTSSSIASLNCRCIPEIIIPGLPPSNMSWKWTQRPKALRSDPLTV